MRLAGLAVVCVTASLALLGGCADDTPAPVVDTAQPLARPAVSETPLPDNSPLSYDYLTKLRLDVSDIALDDGWTPSDGAEHVEQLATPPPIDAIRRMVRDRLVAAGGGGQASVTITDASLTRGAGQLIGSFAVSVVLPAGAGGTPPPPVVAAVSATRTLGSDADAPATANALLRDLMDKLNVELEYQVRHQVAQHLVTGTGTGAVPSAVQSQDLNTPGAIPLAQPGEPAVMTEPAPPAVPPAVPDATGAIPLAPPVSP